MPPCVARLVVERVIKAASVSTWSAAAANDVADAQRRTQVRITHMSAASCSSSLTDRARGMNRTSILAPNSTSSQGLGGHTRGVDVALARPRAVQLSANSLLSLAGLGAWLCLGFHVDHRVGRGLVHAQRTRHMDANGRHANCDADGLATRLTKRIRPYLHRAHHDVSSAALI